jgi:hypothetical protein
MQRIYILSVAVTFTKREALYMHWIKQLSACRERSPVCGGSSCQLAERGALFEADLAVTLQREKPCMRRISMLKRTSRDRLSTKKRRTVPNSVLDWFTSWSRLLLKCCHPRFNYYPPVPALSFVSKSFFKK